MIDFGEFFFFFSGFWVHGLIRVALDASCGCGLIGVVERLVWVDCFGGGVLICKLWVVVMVVLGFFFFFFGCGWLQFVVIVVVWGVIVAKARLLWLRGC